MSEPMIEPAEPVVEPAAEPAEPAEPAWAGPSAEEWQTTQQALQYMAQALFPQEQQQPEIDPFDRGQLSQLAREEARRVLDEEASMAAAGEQAYKIIDGFGASDGPLLFDGSRERVHDLANSVYIGQTVGKFGKGPQAATEALRLAYKQVRDEETKIGEAYHKQQMDQLQGLGSVRREPAPAGQTGAASQLIAASGPGDETALLRKYFGG